jgi:benzaldehyde dehydrogenase (NAD)
MSLLEDRRWEKSLFDGTWRPAGLTEQVRGPATGEVLAEVGQASAADVAAAAGKAEAAQAAWAASSPGERRDVLLAAAASSPRPLVTEEPC